MIGLDIIIPHVGSGKRLKKCLDSLEPYNDRFDEVKVINQNRNNRGFTWACNKGIKETKGQFVMLLNDDCYPFIDPFKPMFDILGKEKSCGIVAPITVWDSNPDIMAFAGGRNPVFEPHMTGLLNEREKTPYKTKWAIFAAVIIRRTLIEEIGLLDRRFFFNCSDCDYCYTARERGWGVWMAPKAVWRHEVNAQMKEGGWVNEATLSNDKQFFIDKWMNGSLFKKLDNMVEPLH